MSQESPNEQLRRILKEAEQGKRKANKYGNQRPIVDGIRFDSNAEARLHAKLKLMKAAGEILDFQYHVQIPLIAEGGELVGHYELDFLVTKLDGIDEYWDVKGGGPDLLTSLFKWKARHVKKQYGIDVIVIDSKTLQPIKK